MNDKLTKEEYLKKLEEINAKTLQLRLEREELRQQYVKDNAQFKEGDKVKIYQDRYTFNSPPSIICLGEFFISKAKDSFYTGCIDYEFAKIKKDGTQSSQSAGIYGYKRLELVTENNQP